MVSTLDVLAAALAISSSCFTPASAQFTNQSAPFELQIISSTNSTLNGSTLFACHEGAALEGLCNAGQVTTVPTSASTFNFNYSDTDSQDSGYLTYLLQGSNFNESEPMSLYYDISSNVALPLFQPTENGQVIAFDANNLLNIEDYISDTVYPPTAGNTTSYYRWYVCLTYYTGYTYETLNWVLGEFPPQNPSCQKVDVLRVYV